MSLWRSEYPKAIDPAARVCIIMSEFNLNFVESLLEATIHGLKRCGIKQEHIGVVAVPGSFELPYACRKAAFLGQFDCIIALGVVIRGATIHFDIIANEIAAGIMKVNLESPIPVIFGVLTCENQSQVEARIELGEEFAKTAVNMMNFDKDFPASLSLP